MIFRLRPPTRLALGCLVFAAALGTGPTGSAATAPRAATSAGPQRLEDWPDGPVRYLMSRPELQDFKKLGDDRARALFIVRFWRRWDPTPATLENESRREYWRRVLESNRRFRDSVRPGWMTDRGRIYILLGEPDQEQKDEMGGIGSLPGRGSKSAPASSSASSGSSQFGEIDTGVDNDSAERGLLRWTYRRLPGNHADPDTLFAFTRDESGEWRLSINPRVYGAVFPGITAAEAGSVEGAGLAPGASSKQSAPAPGQEQTATSRLINAMERVQQTLALSETGRASLMALDRAEATRVPGPGEAAGEIVTSAEFLGKLPAESRFAFFRAADGNTLVRVGAAIQPKSLYADAQVPADLSSFLLVYARFSPESARSAPGAPAGPGGSEPASLYASNEDSPVAVTAKDASADAPLEAWASRTVPPGRYEAGLGLEDAATGQATSLRQPLEVPSLGGAGLALSSLLPVRALGQSAEGLRPAPRVSATFDRSGEFGIYFEVYGLAAGEPFALTNRFFLIEGAAARPIGKPIRREGLTDPAQGWTFPLAKWPAGAYRLEITAEQGTATASASLDFTVR